MTRRDTIIIASLLNMGLLGLLFFTASREDDTKVLAPPPTEILAMNETADPIMEDPIKSVEPPSEMNSESDELDQALKEFLPEEKTSRDVATSDSVDQELNPSPLPKKTEPVSQPAAPAPASPKGTMVEVTVKRGDALEKIARANNTTIQAIKEANNLKSDTLKVGQVLKVPVDTVQKKSEKKFVTQIDTEEAKPQVSIDNEPVYYTIKSGDNPWKIAKQYKVKFEDILKLNNMSEEKAKNLKVGDKIRVK